MIYRVVRVGSRKVSGYTPAQRKKIKFLGRVYFKTELI